MIPGMTTPSISYALSPEAWGSFEPRILQLIRAQGLRRIVEIGGGANPMIPIDQVRAMGLDYTLLDISETELAKAPAGYRTVCADIASASPDLGHGSYDLAFSRMLAEHVRSGAQLHRNIHGLLRPGGHAMHFFPTMWALPFVVNRYLPERLSDGLVALLNPGRDRHRFGKFPAYYDWCRGPTRRQLQRFARLGYQVSAYDGYFGHSEYYRHIPPLKALHLRWSDFLSRHPHPALTSFAILHLTKIGNPAA